MPLSESNSFARGRPVRGRRGRLLSRLQGIKLGPQDLPIAKSSGFSSAVLLLLELSATFDQLTGPALPSCLLGLPEPHSC